MKKKGFTLVEIILAISIIVILGLSTTFITFNKKEEEIKIYKKNALNSSNVFRTTNEALQLQLNDLVNDDDKICISLEVLYTDGLLDVKDYNKLINENLNYIRISKTSLDHEIIETIENCIEYDKNYKPIQPTPEEPREDFIPLIMFPGSDIIEISLPDSLTIYNEYKGA